LSPADAESCCTLALEIFGFGEASCAATTIPAQQTINIAIAFFCRLFMA
jgi:hypothetical protein